MADISILLIAFNSCSVASGQTSAPASGLHCPCLAWAPFFPVTDKDESGHHRPSPPALRLTLAPRRGVGSIAPPVGPRALSARINQVVFGSGFPLA